MKTTPPLASTAQQHVFYVLGVLALTLFFRELILLTKLPVSPFSSEIADTMREHNLRSLFGSGFMILMITAPLTAFFYELDRAKGAGARPSFLRLTILPNAILLVPALTVAMIDASSCGGEQCMGYFLLIISAIFYAIGLTIIGALCWIRKGRLGLLVARASSVFFSSAIARWTLAFLLAFGINMVAH